jgi:hypothetical protein
MRARRLPSLAAGLAAAVLLAAGGAACSLIAGIDQLQFVDGGAPVCGAACDDGDPCTTGDCMVGGTCAGTPAADGTTPGGDMPGDCKKPVCQAGMLQTENDDTDAPSDGEDCTTDTCSDGSPVHTAKPDMAACMVGAASGACQAGKCAVGCGPGVPCDDKNPCTGDTCTNMVCAFTALPDGMATPMANDPVGDCKKRVCMGGVDTAANDDMDLPAPPNDCTKLSCSGGAVVSSMVPKGNGCSTQGGKLCDGAGSCVACLADGDCSGATDDCQHPGCSPAHACAQMFTAAMTKLPAAKQPTGDCHVLECDGAGMPMNAVDDTDVPVDNNPCTSDVCALGVPSNPPLGAGKMCGNGQTCDGMGHCGCMNDAQCTPPATCGGGGTPNACGCTKKTCGQVGATCGPASDGCGGTIQCDDAVKDGSETDVDCGGGGGCPTKCAQGAKCKQDADCGTGHCADGLCCNTACTGTCLACNVAGSPGVCSPVPKGLIDATAASPCIGAHLCDGMGNCLLNNAQTCAMGSQCLSGNCADGVCCDSSCQFTCMACDVPGQVGTCSNVPQGGVDFSPSCNGSNACDGNGLCKFASGEPCFIDNQCASGFCNGGTCQ